MRTNFVKAGSRQVISVTSHSLDKTNELFATIANEESDMGTVLGQIRNENACEITSEDEDKKLDQEIEAWFNRNEIQTYLKILKKPYFWVYLNFNHSSTGSEDANQADSDEKKCENSGTE